MRCACVSPQSLAVEELLVHQPSQSNRSFPDMSSDSNEDSQQAPAEAPMADVILTLPDAAQTWIGGEHSYNGTHDPFCFMCGDGENITGCQTCSRCYHTQCMFPPLEPSQVPEVWFCPVCVGRNWHIPPIMTQAPHATHIDNTEQQGNTSVTGVIGLPKLNPGSSAERSGIPENQTQSLKDSQAWKDAQRWKENSSYAPRGHILDPSSADRFIPLYGDGPSIPFSTVIKNRLKFSDEVYSSEESARHSQSHPAVPSSIPSTSQGKPHRTGKLAGNKSPPRKRSKYSDVPADVENALDLIKSHLANVSQFRKSQVDVENKAQVLEQKIRMQDGQMAICRQELQAVKQKLSIEFSNTERLKAENADLRKEVQELRSVAQKKEDQMKNWQNMLRTIMGEEGGSATS